MRHQGISILGPLFTSFLVQTKSLLLTAVSSFIKRDTVSPYIVFVRIGNNTWQVPGRRHSVNRAMLIQHCACCVNFYTVVSI